MSALPSMRSREAARLVLAALDDLSDRPGGTSMESIVDHIAAEYNVTESDIKRLVPGVVDRGVAFGAIERRRGRLMIGQVMESMREGKRRRRRKKPDGEKPTKKRKSRRRSRH